MMSPECQTDCFRFCPAGSGSYRRIQSREGHSHIFIPLW